MPILNVKVIGELPDSIRKGLARRLADAAAEVLKSGPQQTWVTVQVVRREDYAENADGQAQGTQPVIASLIKRQVPRGRVLGEEVTALTQAIAAACGRSPEHTHIIYEPAGGGRIAFGGDLVPAAAKSRR